MKNELLETRLGSGAVLNFPECSRIVCAPVSSEVKCEKVLAISILESNINV